MASAGRYVRGRKHRISLRHAAAAAAVLLVTMAAAEVNDQGSASGGAEQTFASPEATYESVIRHVEDGPSLLQSLECLEPTACEAPQVASTVSLAPAATFDTHLSLAGTGNSSAGSGGEASSSQDGGSADLTANISAVQGDDSSGSSSSTASSTCSDCSDTVETAEAVVAAVDASIPETTALSPELPAAESAVATVSVVDATSCSDADCGAASEEESAVQEPAETTASDSEAVVSDSEAVASSTETTASSTEAVVSDSKAAASDSEEPATDSSRQTRQETHIVSSSGQGAVSAGIEIVAVSESGLVSVGGQNAGTDIVPSVSPCVTVAGGDPVCPPSW